MNRKRLLLSALVGLLILSLAYAFWAMPRQEKAVPRVAGKSRPSAPKPAAGKKEPPPADRLHLGLLAQEPQPFSGADRDIFRFRGGGIPPVDEVQAIIPVQEEPPPPPPPPPPPTPEELLHGLVSQVTFLGFLDKGGERTVFLSGGGELYLVKTGEGFGKNKALLAKEITDKFLIVGWPQGPETVRVELVENEALKPAILTSGPAGASPAHRFPTTGLRPGGAGFPPRRILPQRTPVQPVAPPEQQEEEIQEEIPQDEDSQQNEVQPEVQPPGDGMKLEELLKKRLQGGEGNGTKQ